MDSPQKLLSDCRSGQRDSLAEYYNRLVHDYPELATAVPSCACTRNVLANRLAAGDLRWLRAEHIDEWEPACIGWLVGWATSRASLEALIPLVQQAGARFPGVERNGGLPGQLTMLDMAGLTAMTAGLLKLIPTSCDDPGLVETLTALHLLVGWRDQVEIPYVPARQIAQQSSPDAETVLATHKCRELKPEMDWQLLKVAVVGPEELRLEAADAWADAWEWRYGALLGLDLKPSGPYLLKAREFHWLHCGRAIAWANRIGQVHWFEPEVAPSFLLQLETEPSSALVESLVAYCQENQQLDELQQLATEWLTPEAQSRFNATGVDF